jgi:hypothetical protein
MQNFINRLSEKINIAPLISFRLLFGIVMFIALCRNLFLGFVHKFYIQPDFFFKYYGFEWVQPLGYYGTYFFYTLLIASTLGIMLGAFYRISAIVFFLLFCYFELLDLTHYLNHYYLISLLSFLLIFLPANRSFSVDVLMNPRLKASETPRWTIFILQYQIALLYFYAGIAKLHPDWLFNAQPLKIWLASQGDLPLLGSYLALPATAYLFSWFGTIYDLSIPFLLWNRKSRPYAYIAVISFHLLSAILFNIGIFPLAMIAFALIFFSGLWHDKIISKFALVFILTLSKLKQKTDTQTYEYRTNFREKAPWFIWIFAIWQLVFPLRHLIYPGNVLWTEEGFRFSWKVMVLDKKGLALFKVSDKSGRETEVNNLEYLTEKQEVFMSYQPDMILQFAHFLADTYKKKGFDDPQVRVDCHVSFNGRPSRRLIDPETDLAKEKAGIQHKPWIILYRDL